MISSQLSCFEAVTGKGAAVTTVSVDKPVCSGLAEACAQQFEHGGVAVVLQQF